MFRMAIPMVLPSLQFIHPPALGLLNLRLISAPITPVANLVYEVLSCNLTSGCGSFLSVGV